MKFEQVKYVFFIGIGGIGMSALARFFKYRQCQVFGYDRTETPLTQSLVAEGISVLYEDDPVQIPSMFAKEPSGDTLVVYTPAIPSNSKIMNTMKENGQLLYKRAQVLGLISEGHYTIAVAGTHGKTTTSTMVAHILVDSGYGCSAFLGGISSNYETNTLIGTNQVIVVEADEYDRSFLTLHPDIAIVTSADADHLDIYGDHEHMQEAFVQFLDQVHPDGRKIVHQGLPFAADTYYEIENDHSRMRMQTTHLHAYAKNVRVEKGYFHFDYCCGEMSVADIRLGLPGRHNVENAVAAMTAALHLQIHTDKIKAALGTFKGVKRRFEYHVRNAQHIYIDDYAHHPTEIAAFLDAVRELYPQKHLTVVFQPHLFTRTRDFLEGFAATLGAADTLLLMEIYPAREEPLPGVNSTALLERIQLQDKHLLTENQVLDYVGTKMPELLVTIGAGNIDRLVDPIRNLLTHV